jgi:hypothetical protein
MTKPYDFNLFNRIKLKTQKLKELDNLCDMTKKVVLNANEEMLFYYKLSNGVNQKEHKVKKNNNSNPNTSMFRKFCSKRILNNSNLRSSVKVGQKSILASKRPSILITTSRFEDSGIKEAAREYSEDCESRSNMNLSQLKKLDSNRASTIKKSKITLPLIQKRLDFATPKHEVSSRRGSVLYTINEKSLFNTEQTEESPNQEKRSSSKMFTSKFKKPLSEIFLQTPQFLTETSIAKITPIGSPRITYLTEATEGIQKLVQEFNKVPSKNVREKFSKLYNEFNNLSKSNIKLSQGIEKSFDDFVHNVEAVINKDRMDQDKIFGKIGREKLFVMDDYNNGQFIRKLDKDQVLKDYNLINVLRDEYAIDVLKKYAKHEQKVEDDTDKKNKMHKKVVDILDAMQYSKYKKKK